MRRQAQRMAAPILGTLCAGYFVWHAFNGDYGIIAWLQLRESVSEASAVLSTTSARRARLEGRAALLGSGSSGVDRDMLDERARMMTGLVDPRDLVVTLGRGGAGQWPPAPAR